MVANTKLKFLFALGVLLVSGAHSANAQQDESWYKEWERHHVQKPVHLSVSASNRPNQPAQTNARSRCDIGVNGDFETYLHVASHVNNMGGGSDINGTGVTYAPDELANWYSPSYGSPDYLATNATSTSEVQPNNENSPYGSFTPHSPIGAIGLYARLRSYNDGIDRDKQAEYATASLPTALATNARYYAELQVSLSHKTQYSNATNYGIKQGFGLMFTSSSPHLANRQFITPTGPTVLSGAIGQSAINYGTTGAANWQRVSGQFTSNGEQYVTVGLFNSDDNNGTLLPNGQASIFNTYFFVDDVQVFKIPTAGSPQYTCTPGSSFVLGEGCDDIPGATYAWSTGGGVPFATTVQTTVSPTSTTAYTLTVTLPDGSTYATSTSVTVTTVLEAPTIVEINQVDCQAQVRFNITNFNPTFTYTINRVSGFVTPLPLHPTTYEFRLKGAPGGAGSGTFTITVTGCGQTVTSDIFDVNYECSTDARAASAKTTTAYPNPANESLILPAGVQEVTLLDAHGKQVLLVPDTKGQLDIGNLPAGLYNLRMNQDGKVINQHLEVKH